MQVPSAAAPTRIGRYLLFGVLASGGMATVHFGQLIGAVGFARTVAIKRLHPHLASDPDFVSMFVDEGRLAARIHHPNVVSTLDVVQEANNELFVVMEYVNGESLSRLIKAALADGESVPLPIVASIVCGALHGLHAAHEAKDETGRPLGVVHRDVSPQNILVGLDGVARVLDFGVAKAEGRLHNTEDGKVKGKLGYMSPEQLQGLAIDRRTDVFGAGVVLWETLARRRLFAADNAGQTVAKVMAADVTRPSLHNPEVSPALDEICLRALQRDPAARFDTARQMAVAIESAVQVASATEVGAWVDAMVGDELRRRAELLKTTELNAKDLKETSGVSAVRAMIPALSGTPPPSVAVSPARSRSSVVLVGILVAALGGAIFVSWQLRRRVPQAPPPVATQPLAAAPAPSASVSPVPIAPPTTQEVASSAVPSSSVTPTAKPRPTARVPVGKPTASSPKPDCNPPYTTGPDGRRHYKTECDLN